MIKFVKLWFFTVFALGGHIYAADTAFAYNYDTRVPIDNKTAANSPQILKQGLLQVLIQVSGKGDIDKSSVIQQAIEKPENYLLKYTVQMEEQSARVSVQTYAANRIDNLLKTAGITVAKADTANEAVNIRVSGINNLGEYTQVSNYLATLAIVNNVKLNKLSPGSLDLSVNTKNGRNALLNILGQDNKLVAENLNNLGQLDNENLLQFRWNN